MKLHLIPLGMILAFALASVPARAEDAAALHSLPAGKDIPDPDVSGNEWLENPYYTRHQYDAQFTMPTPWRWPALR